MSWPSIALLACAVLVLVGAEWPRLSARIGPEARARRIRARRKESWRVLGGGRSGGRSPKGGRGRDVDDFAASVQRDLARLPTIEERRDRKR